MRPGRRLSRAALFASAAAALGGCVVGELGKVRKTEAISRQYAYIAGSVRYDLPDPAERPDEDRWIVVYVVSVPCSDEWRALANRVAESVSAEDRRSRESEYAELAARLGGELRLADHVVLQRSGFWYVRIAPGCYGVGAFADSNRNQRYDDEPLASSLPGAGWMIELGPGDRREGVDLAIDARVPGRLRADLPPIRTSRFRTHQEQLFVSLAQVTVEGELADLSDPRFGPESGRIGYFDVFRFLWEVRPGVYFLEPYDPKRVPVLFVHGAMGFPRSFAILIARLDRERFQPRVAFYPSGSRLAAVAEQLSRNLANLQRRLGFEELAVVAHSMGGLVSRALILRHHARMTVDPIRVFVSLARPGRAYPPPREASRDLRSSFPPGGTSTRRASSSTACSSPTPVAAPCGARCPIGWPST
jgi:hypothetical protein